MINKLYSILVSGSDPVPESWFAYRRYTRISNRYHGIPSYTDPYKRSVWANYIIEMAKLCPLYDRVLIQDPANTYKNRAVTPKPTVTAKNCSILDIVWDIPKVSIVATVEGGLVSGTYNNLPFAVELTDGKAHIHCISLRIPEDVYTIEVDILNPCIGLSPLDPKLVKDLCSGLDEDIISRIDFTRPQDVACALCLYLLSHE